MWRTWGIHHRLQSRIMHCIKLQSACVCARARIAFLNSEPGERGMLLLLTCTWWRWSTACESMHARLTLRRSATLASESSEKILKSRKPKGRCMREDRRAVNKLQSVCLKWVKYVAVRRHKTAHKPMMHLDIYQNMKTNQETIPNFVETGQRTLKVLFGKLTALSSKAHPDFII